MKIIQICNWHRVRGGREKIAAVTADILARKGHTVRLVTRDSQEILEQGLLEKARAFGGAFYSRADRKFMANLIRDWRPEVVHVHGLLPFFSPWMLVECRSRRVPVVFTCHDFSLTCPTDHHLRGGMVCERCLHGRELWCALLNCRRNVLESWAYAIRSAFLSRTRLLLDNVDVFTTPARFVEDHLVRAGFPRQRIRVVPNLAEVTEAAGDISTDDYVAFVGRISPEKGVASLLAAARSTGFPIRLAGDFFRMPELPDTAPDNALFLGPLGQPQLAEFYSHARFLVVPSIWYEIFPLVVLEGMKHGLPVIASRMGGMPEIVEDGVTGLLFEAGNAEDLAAKMRILWADRHLCQEMGNAGRAKVVREYGEESYYTRLMAVYEKALSQACSTQS